MLIGISGSGIVRSTFMMAEVVTMPARSYGTRSYYRGMVLRIVAAAFLFAAAGCGEQGGAAVAPLPAGPGPRITFEEMVHEFGPVSDTRTYSTAFRFSNTGDETLVISDVKPACGCTVPTLSRRSFASGEGGVIEVAFDPSGQHGVVDKYIAVVSNAVDGPVKLRISALVRPLLGVDKFQRLGRLPLGRETTHRLELSYEDPELHITNLSGNNPHVTARIAEMGQNKGAIEVTVSKEAPWGVVYATRLAITVYGRPEPGADPVEHEYTVFVTGEIFGELIADPAILSLGNLEPGRPCEAAAMLSSESGRPFSVLSAEIAESDLPGLEARVEPQGPSAARVVVHGATGTYRGSFNGAVRIVTDVPGEDALTLRFGGFVR